MIPLLLLVLASHGHAHHKKAKSELSRALLGLEDQVASCLPDGATGGSLKARWEITTTGEATDVFVDRDRSHLEEEVIDCAIDKIQDYSFPSEKHDRQVSHTFHLGQAHTKHRHKKR